MKRIISLSLVMMLCASLLFAATSCAAKHPIEEFKDKMAAEKNYQMTITLTNIPLFGTMTVTTKVDGNITYTPAVMFNEEEYTETVDGVEYKYTKNDDGKWTKTKVEVDEDSSEIADDESMQQLFNPENYEKVKDEKNTYKQKKDVTFDNFEDVVMTIDEDSCTIEMTATEGGYGAKIVISKIGEIDLTLPTVE